ncbi:fructosamine kinase family protein [Candidatus Bathyarchaeota archaeon]|nr:fructosamine kinase family protein [Candidatus Bathyarchaeota archaeon]
MLNGEWESSKMIHTLMPDFIPQPFGFGKYQSTDYEAYFYLSEFLDMDVTTAPDASEFTARLAEMHKLSQSPTGKFGFPITTCDGKLAHTVDWEDSWAVFFRKLLIGVCKLDIEMNGSWPELERATEQVANKVVPRLLDNLKSAEGDDIKPCIIHGDLWEGNMGIDLSTGDTTLFDAGSYFAHNEMELGHWRCQFSSVFRAETYTRHYLRSYPAAEPSDEFDDRNRLYGLKGAMDYAAGHPGSLLRKTYVFPIGRVSTTPKLTLDLPTPRVYNDMCYLCEKYAPIDGIDAYDPRIDPSITGASIVAHLAEGLI